MNTGIVHSLVSLYWKFQEIYSLVQHPHAPTCALFLSICEGCTSAQDDSQLCFLHGSWLPRGSRPTEVTKKTSCLLKDQPWKLQYHFWWILLVKVSHKVHLDSRGREIIHFSQLGGIKNLGSSLIHHNTKPDFSYEGRNIKTHMSTNWKMKKKIFWYKISFWILGNIKNSPWMIWKFKSFGQHLNRLLETYDLNDIFIPKYL